MTVTKFLARFTTAWFLVMLCGMVPIMLIVACWGFSTGHWGWTVGSTLFFISDIAMLMVLGDVQ